MNQFLNKLKVAFKEEEDVEYNEYKRVAALAYEDQVALMRDIQLRRTPYPSPKLLINPDIKTLTDLETENLTLCL